MMFYIPPKAELRGGQQRLTEATLYICQQCEAAPSFSLSKLNKILWRSDFRSFVDRGRTVTGRPYHWVKQGPVPVEMAPVLKALQFALAIEIRDERPIALQDPFLRFFTTQDLQFIDRAIEWFMQRPAGLRGRATGKRSLRMRWAKRWAKND